MFFGPYSMAVALVMPRTANFAPVYPTFGVPCRWAMPAAEEMLTMDPPPASIMPGRIARIP